MAESERIPTSIRPILVLEALARAGRALTPTEVGRRLDLPKPTIHRLCATMLEDGLLARDPASKGYRPGRRARELANGLLHAGVDTTIRRQILTRVSAAVHETVNFAAPTDDGMTYVDRVETDWAFRIQLPIGALVPFHCTASGKTYLSSLAPAKRRAAVRAMSLERRTANTITDPDALLEELARIAKQGYAVDNEELMEGMVALAVPVRDPDGRFLAALAFHGPSPRLTIASAMSHLGLLQKASEELTEAFFGG